jgi:cell division protein FtsB
MKKVQMIQGVYISAEQRREATAILPSFPVRKALLLVLCLAAAGFFKAWVAGRYIHEAYGISAAISEQKRLLAERDQYRTEILCLRSPDRIESLARNELGMAVPTLDRLLK